MSDITPESIGLVPTPEPPAPDPVYARVANSGVLYVQPFAQAPTEPDWRLVVDTPKPTITDTQECVQTGWTITDTTASQTWAVLDRPAPDAPVVVVPPSDVPTEVPLWAFRAVLTVQGIAPQVDGLIAALPEPQKTVAQVQWEFGNYIVRSHPLIVALGAQIGMTAAQIDDVFRQAAALK